LTTHVSIQLVAGVHLNPVGIRPAREEAAAHDGHVETRLVVHTVASFNFNVVVAAARTLHWLRGVMATTGTDIIILKFHHTLHCQATGQLQQNQQHGGSYKPTFHFHVISMLASN